MIIVNLSKSYPPVGRALAQLNRVPRPNLDELALITLGDWYRLSEKSLQKFGDVIVGTYGGRVVSIYSITGYQRAEDNTVRFTGRSAPTWTRLIGQAQPQGPWRRGEARGTRYVDTAPLAEEWVSTDTRRDWREAVHQIAKNIFPPDDTSPSVRPPAGATVAITWTGEKSLEITIPADVSYRVLTK